MVTAHTPVQHRLDDAITHSQEAMDTLSRHVAEQLSKRFSIGFIAEARPMGAYVLSPPGTENSPPPFPPALIPEGYVIALYAHGHDSYREPDRPRASRRFVGTISVTDRTALIDLHEPQFARAARDVIERYS